MPKLIDETNNKYGRLTVLYRANTKKKGTYWHCRCDCGNEIDVLGSSLRNGNTKSCGCLKHEQIIKSNIQRGQKVQIGDKYNSLTIKDIQPRKLYCQCDCGNTSWLDKGHVLSGHTKTCGCRTGLRQPNYIDETGNRYGLLTVIEDAGRDKDGRVLWKCRCDCGNEKIALGKTLRAGLIKSCGCLCSLGEQKVNQLLSHLHISFETQKSFVDLVSKLGHPLFFDFYLPDYNVLIEYQGEQHYTYSGRGWNTYEHFLKLQERDELKRQYCKQNNLKLIEIPYTDFQKLNEEYILTILEDLNESYNS